MAEDLQEEKKKFLIVPRPCQYESLGKNRNVCNHNENISWLADNVGKYPLWSPLRSTYCAKQEKLILLGDEKGFTSNIPGRLISLFGSSLFHTNCANKMAGMGNYHLLSNVYALCAALSYQQWSEDLLNSITLAAVNNYPQLLTKLSITDSDFNRSRLNNLYTFKGIVYNVQVQQVAAGTLYFRGIVTDFNLARNLNWFFERYQFGLLHCLKRCLAFGHVLNSDYGFFMYDCQTTGFPLYPDRHTNSYILRTPFLQVLLYCIIATLNISREMPKFSISNVDIRIVNPSEKSPAKRKVYVPILKPLKQKLEVVKQKTSFIKKSVASIRTSSTTSTLQKSKKVTKASKKVGDQKKVPLSKKVKK